MYFPLLRGKQFELVALKEFAEAYPGNQWICPIIEPVRVLPDALVRAAGYMSGRSINYAVILNPENGDYAVENNRFEIPTFLQKFEDFAIKPIPAFFADGKSVAVKSIIDDLALQDVMVIYEDSLDIENEADVLLCNHPSVSYIVSAGADSRRALRFLMKTGKNIIRLDDNFEVRKPNSAYRVTDEDPYTEEPFYYRDDHFYGFSDYCVLPKAFTEGGMTPTAVAIHMTYRKREDAIWVRHFVSDEALDAGKDIRRKFESAMEAFCSFYNDIEPTNAARALMDKRGNYPGLGVLKKITMLNHMQLITSILPTL